MHDLEDDDDWNGSEDDLENNVFSGNPKRLKKQSQLS